MPASALALARRFEGLKLSRYLCPAGYWTIGYEHRCPPNQQPIILEQAEALLAADMVEAVATALKLCPVLVTEPADRLAALADFAFNLGPSRLATSTLRRRVNARDWPAAAVELRRRLHGGGRVLPGLVARREAEAELLLGAK